MKKVILHGTDMVKTFGETKVLQGISLELYEGDFTVIMGSSGSGKSTLLYALSGMDRLSGGQLFYKGTFSDEKRSSDGRIDISHASEKELTYL
ncbi:MAG: ATP-binding cassette domain-containing protein, partial [Lachnospiraceae bacterium]|nr:ATP-binding cassette domain-containing protein [Lachnospiraceae bacterium]